VNAESTGNRQVLNISNASMRARVWRAELNDADTSGVSEYFAAVFNTGGKNITFSLELKHFELPHQPVKALTTCKVLDVWTNASMGMLDSLQKLEVLVGSHDARFIRLSDCVTKSA
jgi:hypothetical protein